MSIYAMSQLMNDNMRPAANQFVCQGSENGMDFVGFQSYNSPICKRFSDGSIMVGRDWDYSKTTAKHLAIFMRDYCRREYPGRKKFQKEIDEGKIVYNPDMKW